MKRSTKRTKQNQPGLGGPGKNGGRKGRRLRPGPGGLRETKRARAAAYATMLAQQVRRHVKRKRKVPMALQRRLRRAIEQAGHHYIGA